MEMIPFYSEKLGLQSPAEVFSFLIKNLKESILLWSYFVNWDKVFSNVNAEVQIALNEMNYLIGSENDFDDRFRALVRRNPSIVCFIPMLLARDARCSGQYKILVEFAHKRFTYAEFDFYKKHPTPKDVEGYLLFLEKTGLKGLLVEKRIRNLVDYVIGVEAGLDSNARKNRCGAAMEDIVGVFIEDVCQRKQLAMFRGADAKRVEREWGIRIPEERVKRTYDFVVRKKDRVTLIETNFYGGGGSKLKATAGEYKDLQESLRKSGARVTLVWITDGKGWESARSALKDAFYANDHIFNLAMLEKGILDEVLAG